MVKVMTQAQRYQKDHQSYEILGTHVLLLISSRAEGPRDMTAVARRQVRLLITFGIMPYLGNGLYIS